MEGKFPEAIGGQVQDETRSAVIRNCPPRKWWKGKYGDEFFISMRREEMMVG